MARLNYLIFNKHRKAASCVAVLFVVFSVSLLFVVSAMRNYPASSTVISPSGRYVMENVRVGKILTLGGMAYLRVIDRQNPQEVYRTPLYDTQSLDMRTSESSQLSVLHGYILIRVRERSR